jgi:aspartyl-tRNA(Asn)/glutamyl-tRNA(Gln) amidotransferase subunit A
VSAGLVPFAIGSETWGSILSPASNCGIAGLRPTYGRVSRYGAMTLSWSLDKLGPMGLTADDCGLVLEAIAGADSLDPTATNRPYTYAADPAEKRWRLGVLKDITANVAEAVRNNFAQTLEVLAQVASIEEVELPALPYEEITRTIVFAEAASAFEELIESGQATELTAPEDHYGLYVRMAVLAKDYIRALRLRGIIAKQIDAVLAGFDALVGPARATPAPWLDQELRSAAGGTARDIMGAIGNGLGLPAITVPNGFSDKGLPTGVQFMGRAYDENAILAVARVYQSLTTWHLRHPPELAS